MSFTRQPVEVFRATGKQTPPTRRERKRKTGGDTGGKAKARASVRTNSSVNALPPSTVGLLAKLPNQVSRFHAPVIIACWKVDGSVRPPSEKSKKQRLKLQVELFPTGTQNRMPKQCCRILDSFRFAYTSIICLIIEKILFPQTV
ncbi:unnamed protein product, partial [Heterotrigona itama]